MKQPPKTSAASGGGSGFDAPAEQPSARLEARLAEARRYFREHHAGATPDLGFATRVAARLAPEPLSALGWAAARLLPAAVAVAIALGWLAARTPVAVSSAAAGSANERTTAGTADRTTDRTTEEDPLTWFLQGRG